MITTRSIKETKKMNIIRHISITHLVILYIFIASVVFSSTSLTCVLDKEVTRELYTTYSHPMTFEARYTFSYCKGRFHETVIASPEFTDQMRDEWMHAHPTQIYHRTVWGWYSNGKPPNHFTISIMVMVLVSIPIFFWIFLLCVPPRGMPIQWY